MQHIMNLWLLLECVVGASCKDIPWIRYCFVISDVGPSFFRWGACEGLTLKAEINAMFQPIRDRTQCGKELDSM